MIADGRDVYKGTNAYIMCLWALKRYRPWSARLAGPALRPLARNLFSWLARHRRGVSSAFGLKTDGQIAAQLKEVYEPRCAGADQKGVLPW